MIEPSRIMYGSTIGTPANYGSMIETPIDILLVEDNPGDIRLTIEALRDSKIRNKLTLARDGSEAMAMLQQEAGYEDIPRPDLILLDLNLPKKSGHEVLAEVKTCEKLRRIPVIVLTTSRAEADIFASYDLYANCYITKPANLAQFMEVIHSIEDFWLATVHLPNR